MKKYNIQNYVRYKNDVAVAVARLEVKEWEEYSRSELIINSLNSFLITRLYIHLFNMLSISFIAVDLII